MKMIDKKLISLLGLLAALAIPPNLVAQTESDGEKVDRLLALMDELHASVPWYYEFSKYSESEFKIPNEVITQVIIKDLEKHFVRMGAKSKLSAMGTDAWPVVSLLLKDVIHSESFEIAVFAADILATIKADEHPDWPSLSKLLRGQSGSVPALKHLLAGKRLNEPPYELFHRRFGLIGLAAVGPEAIAAISDIEKVLRTKDDHELWVPAMKALEKISGDLTASKQFLMNVVQDTEGYPRVRSSAIKALAISLPDAPETVKILQSGLQDAMSIVRLAAAQEMWRLNGTSEEVLPTLTKLLQSKLASVRVGALTTISEMGNAAQAIRSKVKQLLHDPKESVRQAAVKTLEKIKK